jgi:hypothetical protein
MDAREIKDQKTLESWLNTRPRSDGTFIAQRSFLRVLPYLFGSQVLQTSPAFADLSFAALRFNLIVGYGNLDVNFNLRELMAKSSISAHNAWLTADSSKLAIPTTIGTVAAYNGARSSAAAIGYQDWILEKLPLHATAHAESAISNGAMTITSNDFAVQHRAQFWQSTERDATALESDIAPLTLPLWPDTPPDWFTSAESAMRTYWNQNPKLWSFWQRWWDAATSGNPLPWDLQRDIALIDDAIWQAGPEKVAERIAQIEKEHLDRQSLVSLDQAKEEHPAPARRMIQTKLIAAQITVLDDLIAAELEFLRSHNGWSRDDLPKVEEHRKALMAISEMVAKMLSALEGDLPTSTALTVIDETLPAVVDKAEELEKKAYQPQVSAEIIAIAAAVKVLTESGVPGDVAAKIAYAEEARGFFKKLLRRWK